MKRGIIGSPSKILRTTAGSISVQPNMTLQDYFYYILYWDKIVIPTNNIFNVLVPNEELLIREGLLERPRIEYNSFSSGEKFFDVFIDSQTKVADELIKNSRDVDWTIHQLGDEVALGNNLVKEFHSIRVEINSFLPVPNDSVSIDEILNFKKDRQPELISLHNTLDSFYIEIVNSGDKNFQTKKSLEELSKAIEDIDRVTTEKFKVSKKYNFIAELNANFGSIYNGIAAGVAVGYYTNPTIIPLTALLGGILPFISLKGNMTYTVDGAKDNLKLNYLANAKKANLI